MVGVFLDDGGVPSAIPAVTAGSLQPERETDRNADVAAATPTADAAARERQRIARELHDRVGSEVAAALRNLELYRMYTATDPVRAGQKIALVEEEMRQALDSIRTIAAALRDPHPVDNLEKALRRSIEAIRPATVAVQLVVNGDERLASPTMLDEVFLVVREAVRNAFAHARARNVVVRIDIVPPELRLEVCDDGVGIVPAAKAGGLGQAIMRERMASLGGSLKISSRPGRGSSIEGRVPLSQHG